MFSNKNIIPHLKGQENYLERINDRAKGLETFQKLNLFGQSESNEFKELKCKSEFFIEPLDWFASSFQSVDSEAKF